jgi:hypothetical protein
MSPRQRDDGYSEEERREGYRLNGIVTLTAIASVLVVSLILAVAGLNAGIALFIAVVFTAVLTFNVKRILERRFREKFPDLGRH